MIEFSQERPQDIRVRGRERRVGVRLGTGAALVVRNPWKLLPLHHLIPRTAARARVEHALISAVVSSGPHKIICHSVYLQTGDGEGLSEAIVALLNLGLRV